MNTMSPLTTFPVLNAGYARAFAPARLSVGLVMPIENHMHSAVPTLERHLERAQLADELGFAALWLRDVPFNVPSFGDAGQTFDPFVYLGLLSAKTRRIGLGVASLILPLRHPAHVAKAAASVDQLSGGRMLLGVASGDRPEEYPAMNMSFEDRSDRFREAFAYIRAMAGDYPSRTGQHGTLTGAMDMLPKPTGARIPLLVTGGSRQHPSWVAEHADGWITYPRDARAQEQVVATYRKEAQQLTGEDRPVMQSLYIDLVDDSETPRPIHLGFRSGPEYLRAYLEALEAAGVNHVALNLRFNHASPEATLERLADTLLPRFPTHGD